jgi:DNA polymerase (family 10)
MENKPISRILRLLSQLMELHEENPFKIKSVANAAFKVDKLPFQIAQKPVEEIEKIDGIGKSIAAKIIELLTTGTIQELENILIKTPPGIVEMLGIKGIGPKKISVIWHELQIENVGELYYACNENRLIEAKGFGLKTQEEIKKVIEFKMAANGKFLYAHVETTVNQLFTNLSLWLNKHVGDLPLLGLAGDFRRACEIIEEVIFVVGVDDIAQLTQKIESFTELDLKKIDEVTFAAHTESGLHVKLLFVQKPEFYLQYFKLTGNEKHVDEVLKLAGNGPFKDEQDIYAKANLAFVEPELREGLDEIELAKRNELPRLITYTDLKGSLHNHSDWSDGVHTLEEMALYCKEALKLEY